ncbi:MAG: hypothetical protein ACOX69_06960 [Coriobacteriales bacterium]
MPSVQQQAPQAQQQAPQAQQQVAAADSGISKGIITGIVAGTAIVIIVLLLILVFRPWGTQSVQTQPAQTTTASTSASTDTAQPSQESASATTDKDTETGPDYYDELYAYYKALGNYDKRVSSAATAFNNYHKKEDYSLRSSYSDDASQLRDEISAEQDDINNFYVESSSSYYNDYEHMKQLASWLYERIDVICRAWDISLEYSYPADYEDEITAPLKAEVDSGQSNNRYYIMFKNHYSKWKPVKR